MQNMRLRLIPMEYQAALPPGILQQPEHVGGALALTAQPKPDDVWDQIDAEQAAVAGVGELNLNQNISNFSFIAMSVSQVILQYNSKRSYLLLQNNGASDVRVAFGRTADLTSGLVLSAGGGFYEPILGTVQSVHGISAAGDSQVTVIEGFRL